MLSYQKMTLLNNHRKQFLLYVSKNLARIMQIIDFFSQFCYTSLVLALMRPILRMERKYFHCAFHACKNWHNTYEVHASCVFSSTFYCTSLHLISRSIGSDSCAYYVCVYSPVSSRSNSAAGASMTLLFIYIAPCTHLQNNLFITICPRSAIHVMPQPSIKYMVCKLLLTFQPGSIWDCRMWSDGDTCWGRAVKSSSFICCMSETNSSKFYCSS